MSKKKRLLSMSNMGSMPLFRGADFKKILNDLERIEAESGLFQRMNRERHIFSIDRNQVYICTYVQRLTQWKTWAQAILGQKTFKEVYTPIGNTTSIAKKLKVKNNVTAFYPDRGLVCKFQYVSSIRFQNGLKNEVRAANAAKGLSFLKSPFVVVDYSNSDCDKVQTIWLKYIDGKKPKKKKSVRIKIALKFLETMFLWYEHHGVSFVDINKFFNEALGENLTYEDLLSYGWNIKDAKLLLYFFSKITKSDTVMPVSWIHGDASVGNCMIDTKGRLVILDWEMSAWSYIIKDVFKLSQQGGEDIKNTYDRWLGKISSNYKKVLNTNMQLNLANVVYNLNLKKKKEYLQKIFPFEQVERKILNLRSQVLFSICAIDDVL